MALFGDGEASVQCYTRGILAAAREHQGHAEGRLPAHLLACVARGIVKGVDCPLRPAMTFCQQRHRQEHRSGSGGKSDAESSIAVGAKGPFERRAHIRKAGKMHRPLRCAWQTWPFRTCLLQPSEVMVSVTRRQLR